MAFGFGFNKQKVLSAAEKFVQQGKLQNAIAEYEKIQKHDNKDLTVANTIGDLYARLGDTAKAIECFKAVGDAYAAQGFTVKGIAMYKKITKLQPSVDGSLKLAELYTQQGLFNDARAQYLQVAEEFMKNGDLEQAVRLFQKVLEMDPENVPMRVKLAEVYVKLDKKKEAWEIFGAAAESLRARGSLAAAEDILQRMLTLDPSNSYVLLMRGRAALESDDPKSAIQYLEKASDIDSHPEGLRDLLKAYLENGQIEKCTPLAEKLLTVHNDPEGVFLLGEGADRLGQPDTALDLYTKHAEHLLATDSAKLLAHLHALITHVQGDAEALEKLLKLLKKSGESTHVNEVAELLAHASVKGGNLERARELYQTLATNEPQNPMHTQNHQQVVDRMEGSTAPTVSGISAEEGALIVEELETTAAVIEQSYPDHVAMAARAAVTDADLFISYNLPDKALVPLLAVLPQAPRDVRLNQRLAALHTRFQRFAEAAVCCRTLEGVYREAGHPDEASRYGELAARYEQNTGGAVAGEVPMAAAASAAHAAEPKTHHEFGMRDVDAGTPAEATAAGDWEQALTVDDGTIVEEDEAPITIAGEGGRDEVAETAEEIRFYLEHFMTDQARAAFEKLETLTHDAGILDPLRAAIEAAGKPAEEPEAEIAEINADEISADEISADEISADDPETFEIELALPSMEAGEETTDAVSGFEQSHHEAPRAFAPPQASAAHEPVEEFGAMHPAAGDAMPAHAEGAQDELGALVADLESSLGDSFPEAAPMEGHAAEAAGSAMQGPASHESSKEALPSWPLAAKPAAASSAKFEAQSVAQKKTEAPQAAPAAAGGGAAAAAAPAMKVTPAAVRLLGPEAQSTPAGNVDLTEMFGELKHELEEGVAASTDEDPETHYNLGVAFREMGLLDEAIAELQKVCASIDRGHPFGQPVQTYTWLAQCFLDKGVPEAAIRWYEKALNIPGLDNEARVAINYEIGSACETAQDKPGALRHFTYVYGANIDYRDVAERIQALKS